MKLSKVEKERILNEDLEKWYIRPFSRYKKFLTEREWAEYQKRLYPFMRVVVPSGGMTKEQARWEILRIFLKRKIRKGEI